MSARDELLGTLSNTICNASNYPQRAQPYLLGGDMSEVLGTTADAILAAGYRKPRTITTAGERTQLKPGTIAVDTEGNAWKRGHRFLGFHRWRHASRLRRRGPQADGPAGGPAVRAAPWTFRRRLACFFGEQLQPGRHLAWRVRA